MIEEIDAEMVQRLNAISARALMRRQGVVDEWTAYIDMALEPEIQRIMTSRSGRAPTAASWR